MSISRLHPFKGVEYLIEALPELQQTAGPVQVIVGGPNRKTPRFGDYGAHLQQRANTLNVADAVHLIGAVEHTAISQYWAAADAVVVPSIAESLNRVAAEAAAVGTPTIVTNTTGISSYVEEHHCGQIVEPRSGHAIAVAASRLLSNRKLWETQSAQGPALAAEFRSRTIARQLFDAYQAVLKADDPF